PHRCRLAALRASAAGLLHGAAAADLDPGLHQCAAARRGCGGRIVGGTGTVVDAGHPVHRRHLAGLCRPAPRGPAMNAHRHLPLLLLLLAACSRDPDLAQYGSAPTLPAPQRALLPTMNIAEPAQWGDRLPLVPPGYAITAIATDLAIPRQTLVLPNGDILVAEGRGDSAPRLAPKDVIAGVIKSKGTTSVEGGDRLMLLRDADGDGRYELQTTFASQLNAPYGLALVGASLFVANQDALVRFEYQEGQTEAAGPPEKLTDLPSALNH